MNIAKHMEAIAIVAITLACVTSYALAAIPAHHAASAEFVNDNTIHTVTITAKRLTAAEKARNPA